jgi:hypothetical protein
MPDDPIPAGSPAADALASLIEIMRSANSPEMWQAQTVLLRRLALQGDVVPSRVPAPKNITEIGGYLNLLEKLEEPEMRSQTLAGILGVAGPNPPLGWASTLPPLTLTPIANDRPEGPWQPSIPLTVQVRSDFAAALQQALAAIHERGGTLPLIAPPSALPPAGPGVAAPEDVLPYLGRVLQVVPNTALADPAVDPIVLARAQASSDPFAAASRVLAAGTVAVPAANWDARQCDAATCTTVAANGAQFIPIAPWLAGAGFYPATPPAQPSNGSDAAWSRFSNITGLIAGTTTLDEELRMLHPAAVIAGSVFADRLLWVWNGTSFIAP